MNKKISGIIFGDSFYQIPRGNIGRAVGAHRIATLLRKRDIDVVVVDFFNAWRIEEIEAFLDKIGQVDFIAYSMGLGILQDENVNAATKLIRSRYPEVKIIVGGTSVLENHFEHVDLFLEGYGEGAVDDLVKFIHTGRFNPFKFQTVVTHDTKKIVNCNVHYPTTDLEDLTTQYREDDFIQPLETLALEVSRGCIFKCKFCTYPLIGKDKNDYIRAKHDIKEEIIRNYRDWGTTRYLITDDTFNDNPIKVELLWEISKEIDFQVSYMAFTRVDLLHAKERDSQLQKMIETGFRGVFFGIESLKLETSKKIGKGFSGQKLKDYLLKIKGEYPKLHITSSLIVGLPEEGVDEVEENFKWMVDNGASDSIPVWNLFIKNDNRPNNTSEFSRNWQNYGYREMSLDEIYEFIRTNKDIDYEKYLFQQAGPSFGYHNIDECFKHVKPWANKHMNFLESTHHAGRMQKWGNENWNSLSGWWAFAASFNNPSLDDKLFTKKKDIDHRLQFKQTNQFVDDYKLKKLAYNYR